MSDPPKILLIYGNKVAYHGSVFGAQDAIDDLLEGIKPLEETTEDLSKIDTAWKNSHEKALIYCYGLTLGLITAGCNELKTLLDWISSHKTEESESTISDKIASLFSNLLVSFNEINYERSSFNSSCLKDINDFRNRSNFYLPSSDLGIASCLKPRNYISKTKVPNCLTRLGSDTVLWNFNNKAKDSFTRMQSFKNESCGLECVSQIVPKKINNKFFVSRIDLNKNDLNYKSPSEYEGLDDLEFDDDTGDLMLLEQDDYYPDDLNDFSNKISYSENMYHDRFVGGIKLFHKKTENNRLDSSSYDFSEDMNKSWRTLDSGLCDPSFQLTNSSKKDENFSSKNNKSSFFQLSKLTSSLTSDMSDFENGLNSLKYRMEASNIELDNIQIDMEDALCNYYNETASNSQIDDQSSICCSCNCHDIQSYESLRTSLPPHNEHLPPILPDGSDYFKFIKDASESRTIKDFDLINNDPDTSDLIFDDDNGIQW